MQDMLQNKTQVETVNFRLYFKVIIRLMTEFAFYFTSSKYIPGLESAYFKQGL